MELCGGTHVEDLSKIYPFKILSEGSVAAGELDTFAIEVILECISQSMRNPKN